jgi:hypothetical protein
MRRRDGLTIGKMASTAGRSSRVAPALDALPVLDAIEPRRSAAYRFDRVRCVVPLRSSVALSHFWMADGTVNHSQYLIE